MGIIPTHRFALSGARVDELEDPAAGRAFEYPGGILIPGENQGLPEPTFPGVLRTTP